VAVTEGLKPFCFYHLGKYFHEKWPRDTAKDIAYLVAEAFGKRGQDALTYALAENGFVLREMTDAEQDAWTAEERQRREEDRSHLQELCQQHAKKAVGR
jgi:hypothetical protein